jgi:pimeloyl-ACP methyl ester carboxylesterase
MRILISFFIGILTFFVPKEKYQKQLDALPDMAHKAEGHDLRGWTYSSIGSTATGMTHWYYAYPCADSTAPVLLMLHGFNTDGRAFTRLTDLSTKYRLIAYNFPEATPLYTGQMHDFVAILDDFCAALGVDSVCVCGNSVGGAIAQDFAATSTRVTVTRLLLISSQAFGATAEDRARNRGMADRLMPYPDYKLYYLLQRSGSLVRLMEKRGFGEDAPGEILVIRRIGWYRQIMMSVKEYDGRATMSAIRCPVIALHGSADKVIPLASARTIQQCIPGARFEVIPGAGHAMVFVQGPAIAARLLALCADGVASDAAQSVKPASN